MASFAIDFALQNLGLLEKWMFPKGMGSTADKEEMLGKQEDEKTLAKHDYEVLQKTVEGLKNDTRKVASILVKQGKAELMASYDFMEQGLVLIYEAATPLTSGQQVLGSIFAAANAAALKEARKKFELAESNAHKAFCNEKFSLKDRLFALKIILFCEKMLYENWNSLWKRELKLLFADDTCKNALIRGSGRDFDAINAFCLALGRGPTLFPKTLKLCKELKITFTQRMVPETIYAEVVVNKYDNQTLLHYVAQKGNVEVLKELLQETCDLNIRQNDNAPIHLAVMHGRFECLKLFIDAGADVNSVADRLWTPLHYAAFFNRIDCMKELIAHGANIHAKDEQGSTPLHEAACRGHLNCINELIARGAEVNAQNNSGETALHQTAKHGFFDCLKPLIDAGVDQKLKCNGATALDLAIAGNQMKCVEFLKNL